MGGEGTQRDTSGKKKKRCVEAPGEDVAAGGEENATQRDTREKKKKAIKDGKRVEAPEAERRKQGEDVAAGDEEENAVRERAIAAAAEEAEHEEPKKKKKKKKKEALFEDESRGEEASKRKRVEAEEEASESKKKKKKKKEKISATGAEEEEGRGGKGNESTKELLERLERLLERLRILDPERLERLDRERLECLERLDRRLERERERLEREKISATGAEEEEGSGGKGKREQHVNVYADERGKLTASVPLAELGRVLQASQVGASQGAKDDDLIERASELHERIKEPFADLSAQEAIDRLSDPSVTMTLALPSLSTSLDSPPRTFTYVGRPEFRHLLKLMGKHRVTNLRGLPGRGKSYLMAAMACYLHTYDDSVTVYILMSQLVGRFNYFVEALVLAHAGEGHTSKQQEILDQRSQEEPLFRFCDANGLVFLIDEENALDNEKETGQSNAEQRGIARTWRNQFFRRGVSCASYRSTFQPLRVKHGILFLLNRPFDIEELSAWITANGYKEGFDDLLRHTGLIPRHLDNYVSDKGEFIRQMKAQMRKFTKKMENEEDKDVRRVLNGEVDELEGLKLDADLFFERPYGEGTLVTVLPFLEGQLRAEMDMRRDEAALREQKKHFGKQIRTVRSIMKEQSERGLQPMASLNGWLAEGLARDCMLLHGRCLEWDFHSSAAYKDGAPVFDLLDFPAEKLQKGVLFYPTEATAKYADLHYVKLEQDGKTLTVRPIQLSVSSWKTKQVNDSHGEWERNSLTHWARPGCTTDWNFNYVLSNALRRDIEADGVSVKKFSVKKFADVHPCLDFLDDLRDPELEMKQCMGTTKDGSKCSKTKYHEGDYYCHHHLHQAAATATATAAATAGASSSRRKRRDK